MHPRSPYSRRPPDFAKLGSKYPSLGRLSKNGAYDFKDSETNREVSRCLLLEDFGIEIEFAHDRLCPPIPNRLNYVLWIEDLVSESRPDDGREVIGIDIGTGSTAIYPLLCCKLNPTWSICALEVDEASLQLAAHNIRLNHLQDRISLLRSDAESPHLLSQHEVIRRSQPGSYAFTMCNPPFYASPEDMAASETMKITSANSACTGSSLEMITPGGEVQFTLLQLEDSLLLREKVQWYTTMLGKLSSVKSIVNALKSHGVTNYALTEFVQGQTRRWGVAWSFMPWRPLPETCRAVGSALQDLLPQNPCILVTMPFQTYNVYSRLEDFLQECKVDWEWLKVKASMSVSIERNTWSRQARRLNLNSQRPDSAAGESMRIQLDFDHIHRQVQLLWRYGLDGVLFESFCGKVKQVIR